VSVPGSEGGAVVVVALVPVVVVADESADGVEVVVLVAGSDPVVGAGVATSHPARSAEVRQATAMTGARGRMSGESRSA
jgi:hypothetical protein